MIPLLWRNGSVSYWPPHVCASALYTVCREHPSIVAIVVIGIPSRAMSAASCCSGDSFGRRPPCDYASEPPPDRDTAGRFLAAGTPFRRILRAQGHIDPADNLPIHQIDVRAIAKPQAQVVRGTAAK
jgi:hypothetical protein